MSTNNGKGGGLLNGKRHTDGGIDAVVTDDNNRPVELETDEAIVNRKSMKDPNTYQVVGTPAQIVSAVNSLNGNGVVIKPGAKLTDSTGKTTIMKLGGLIENPNTISHHNHNERLKYDILKAWSKNVNATITQIQNAYKNDEQSDKDTFKIITKLKTTSKVSWSDSMYNDAANIINQVEQLKSDNATSGKLLLFGHKTEDKEDEGNISRLDPQRDKFVEQWKSLFNMTVNTMADFHKDYVKKHGAQQAANDFNLSTYQIKLSKQGKEDQMITLYISGKANHQRILELRDKPASAWTKSDLKFAQDFEDLYTLVKGKPTHSRKDSVTTRWKNMGIDLSFERMSKPIPHTEKSPEPIKLPFEYKVKNVDFQAWISDIEDGFTITEVGAIIRGYVGKSPKFIYNNETEIFTTSLRPEDGLPKAIKIEEKQPKEIIPMPQGRKFEHEYRVKHADFKSWYITAPDTMFITTAFGIVRGYDNGHNPVFIYIIDSELFTTNMENKADLPKGKLIKEEGGEINASNSQARKNMPGFATIRFAPIKTPLN